MKKFPENFYIKTTEEKSEFIHSLTDEELWNITPSVCFLFYYCKKADSGDEIFRESYTLYKNSKMSKSHIKMFEGFYGFLNWDNVLGSQKLVNHIKSL